MNTLRVARLYFWIASLLTMFVLLAGCSQKPDETSSGEELFNYHCAKCHQKSGTGKLLQRIPANSLTKMSKPDVVNLIRKGSPTKPHMPAIEQVDYAQARKIVDYLWVLRAENRKK